MIQWLGISLQPLPHDFLDLLSFQRLVNQQMIGQRGQCHPQIVLLESVIKLDRNLLQIFEPLTLTWIKGRRCFPCLTPVSGPFGDEARMVRVAGIDHLSDRPSQADLHGLLGKLFVADS